ncbi:LacI family DNA-binding transcriptional regulator [Arthrobacter sp. 2MCAF15]|uniref:LacI family DNA-binding transcriptional regulator n=1 Tax=Arthrobacter sp. 2MCAF15 TaxID=3232984 RepID=UPI003F8F2295
MANIHDVAKLAGVSIATVSRMLAGENVRSAEAIRQAISDLGYRPNASARGLRLGKHHCIAVIVPDISNPYFAALVRGIEERVMTRGFRIIVASSDEQFSAESELLGNLVDAVDAVAIVPAEEGDRTRRLLADLNKPVVLIDRSVGEEPGFDLVHVDNASGAKAAADYLLSLGHRRIGIISGRQDTVPGRARHQAFLETLAAAGITVPAEAIKIGEFSRDFGRRAAQEMIGQGLIGHGLVGQGPTSQKRPDGPAGITAVFAANNTMAQGALLYFHAAGVSIPGDLSFICFDDFELAELLPAPVTVISRPAIAEGHAAADLLLRRIEHFGSAHQPPLGHKVLPVSLIIRQSCAAPAAN